MFGYLPGPTLCCTRAATTYRAHFCGLAGALHQGYGPAARFLVNRDSTFLTLLASGLAPQAPATCLTTCCNPLGRTRPLLVPGPALHYVAAITVAGLVTKVEDDAQDERGPRRWLARLGVHALGDWDARASGVLHALGFPVAAVRHTLHSQADAETAAEGTATTPPGALPDPGAQLALVVAKTAAPTQAAYGEITAHLGRLGPQPLPAAALEALRQLGHHLGLLIYCQDAWDDWAADRARHRFNPLLPLATPAGRQAVLAPLLRTALSGLTRALADLPLLRQRDLLQATLIAGATHRVDGLLHSSPAAPAQAGARLHLNACASPGSGAAQAQEAPPPSDGKARENDTKDRQRKRRAKDRDDGDCCGCSRCDCSGCHNCGDCCECLFRGPKSCCSGKGGCDCNPCDGDCCGCDCSP